MTSDRDKICKIVLGLTLVFAQPSSQAAELKRLPPIESPPTQPINALLKPAKPKSARGGVTQSVWLQPETTAAGQVDSKAKPGAVQLVNWDDEPIVPPVQIELESGSEPVMKPILSSAPDTTDQRIVEPTRKQQAPTLTKFVSQQATEQPSAQPKDPATPSSTDQQATPPATTEATPAEPAAGQTPAEGETVQPGTPFVEDDGLHSDSCDSSACFFPVLPPCWYFQSEALMLIRSSIPTIKIVEEGTGAPVRGQRDPLLTTDSLDSNPAWGPRFTLGRYLNCVHNLELVYFGMYNWSSQTAFDGANATGFSFNNIDVPFDSNFTSDFDGGQFVSADYASKIDNAEVNLITNNRWDLNVTTGYPWYHYVDFLMGFRYFRLSEEFDLRSTDAGDTSDYLIDTVNDLVGGQVGMVFGTNNSPRLSWNLTTKAGLYSNFGRQSTLLRDDNNTVVLRDFVTEGNQLAFVGDTNFNLVYNIRPNVSVTAGYYLLYVGGVALAPEQLDFTTTPTSGSRIDQNGDAFYHGPSVGLRILF